MFSKKNNLILMLLAITFLLAFILLSFLFHSFTHNYATHEAEKLVQNSLLTHRAIHSYINTISRPEIYRLKDEGLLYNEYFSPKTMSFTYIARGIKDFLNKERKRAGLPEISFKLASINPRNRINTANKLERQLLMQMNNDDLENYHEVITDKEGESILYYAIPTKPITKSCLRCHGDPDDAPKEMLELYSNSAGFNEELGDIRALISIRIALKGYIQDAQKIANIFTAITFIALLLLYTLIWYFIHHIDKQQQLIVQKNIKLEHLAAYDSLTGLPNYRYFKDFAENRIKQADRSAKKVAFFYIDLDGFKAINDELSHQAGDTILSTIAERFILSVRKNELIARIGGDEFAMVIYGYRDYQELENTAKRLIQECTKTILVGGIECKIGMSIGIATYPEDASSYDKLICLADDVMYQVKNKNKGTYKFFKKEFIK
ncbi:MAG: diguanylate cyclase [Pseudomonadota bacterium]